MKKKDILCLRNLNADFKFCIYYQISYLVISIFGSPLLLNVFVLSKFKQPNVLSSQLLCRQAPRSPKKEMIEFNIAIIIISSRSSSHVDYKCQTSRCSNRTLNDANMLPDLT